MQIVGIITGILVAVSLAIAVRNRYWGKPKATHEKTSTPVTNPLKSRNWQERLAAVNALSRTQSPKAYQQILDMLNDSDEDVRTAARVGLLTYGEQALPDFIDYLHNADNHDARTEAAIALRAYSSDDALDALIVACKDDSRFVRQAVAETLAFMHDDRAQAALESLRHDADSDVRAVVQAALDGA